MEPTNTNQRPLPEIIQDLIHNENRFYVNRAVVRGLKKTKKRLISELEQVANVNLADQFDREKNPYVFIRFRHEYNQWTWTAYESFLNSREPISALCKAAYPLDKFEDAKKTAVKMFGARFHVKWMVGGLWSEVPPETEEQALAKPKPLKSENSQAKDDVDEDSRAVQS